MSAAIVLAFALTGCETNAPVAAPTSTLPAPAEPTPTVPAYETELDLSAEEKQAVEGALLAFDGFFLSINRAYSGDFEATNDFPKYASGDALKSINTEASNIESGQATFEGSIHPQEVSVVDILAESGGSPSELKVHFCVDTTQWSMIPKGASSPPKPDGSVTMEHKISIHDNTWKVERQELWERRC
ncbi:hypothetical protein DFO66_103198 [Brevibacterium sanguinis]|uniref:Nuclear transport factor 2 family protein n=1 Tax=Brevibacterium sanguinis TaxID=232444 RepID=A0ABX9GRI3_9MICO|nr:hypothetical protein DFO66_103198 [Brevibacterium sanguinis]